MIMLNRGNHHKDIPSEWVQVLAINLIIETSHCIVHQIFGAKESVYKKQFQGLCTEVDDDVRN